MNVRQVVQWLGPEGARAGLLESKTCTIEVLKEIAEELRIEVPGRPKKSELVDQIVRVASRRIDKPIDDLFGMREDELLDYFERVQVEREELVDLLKQLDVHAGKEGQQKLLFMAARELAETGRFMRIAATK